MKKIKETSLYRVEDEKGNVLKERFKDLEDSLEFAVNYLLAHPEVAKVVIKAEITVEAKR